MLSKRADRASAWFHHLLRRCYRRRYPNQRFGASGRILDLMKQDIFSCGGFFITSKERKLPEPGSLFSLIYCSFSSKVSWLPPIDPVGWRSVPRKMGREPFPPATNYGGEEKVNWRIVRLRLTLWFTPRTLLSGTLKRSGFCLNKRMVVIHSSVPPLLRLVYLATCLRWYRPQQRQERSHAFLLPYCLTSKMSLPWTQRVALLPARTSGSRPWKACGYPPLSNSDSSDPYRRLNPGL